jgi:group II intron reverse transcriptase/maturase
MQTSLQRIANKAQVDAKHKFGNLYGMLNEDNLHWCFTKRLNKNASPGVDKKSWHDYAEELDGNIENLVESLKNKSYKAKLILRKYIPKDGGQRPLGIPIVADKLLQTCASTILEAIYEQDFKDFSNGYRRGRGPRNTALDLRRQIQFGRFRWVVDADIKGFFDNIDHDWMIRMLEERINDKAFLQLIRKWLKAGIIEEDGKIISPVTGTPQGGSISAVLANIYLHYALDLWFEKRIIPNSRGAVNIMRFADDFVCCFQYKDEAQAFYEALKPRMAKFNLKLAEDKTKTIIFTRFRTSNNESFVFLGFEFRWGVSRNGKPIVKMKTAKKKYKLALNSIKSWIKTNRSSKTCELMKSYRQKLQGHWNYYGVCGNSKSLNSFFWEANKIVFKWLNRRSQRKSYNWEGYRSMIKYFNIPTPKIIAR